MLTEHDKSRVRNIVTGVTGKTPYNIRFEDGELRFSVDCGADLAEKACVEMLNLGLQATPGDGRPEYFKDYVDGADKVDIRWPIDTSRDIWNR